MLVVKIKESEKIVIKPGIEITWEHKGKRITVSILSLMKIHLDFDCGVLRAGVDAPKEIRVDRVQKNEEPTEFYGL